MFLTIGMAAAAVKTAQFLLSFSFIVIVHVLGHYAAARYFKCPVGQVYLFFHPWFSLWKKKIGHTEFGIGWIPIGGPEASAPMPSGSRGEAPRQRLAIALAGIGANLVAGSAMLWLATESAGHVFVNQCLGELSKAVDGVLHHPASSIPNFVDVFPAGWGLFKWMVVTGLLSIAAGVSSLLPIPGTDGGDALLILVEMATGWKPGRALTAVITAVSMLILLVWAVCGPGHGAVLR